MAFQFKGWAANLLGVHSVAQLGAQQIFQHSPEALANVDCSGYLNSLPKGYEKVSLSVVSNNLAVIPDWTTSGTGTSWFQASSINPELIGCTQQIKSSSYISFNDGFLTYIGTSARFEHAQVFQGIDAEHVHEAPVYVPQLDELIYADTMVVGWLWALNTKTHEVSQQVRTST